MVPLFVSVHLSSVSFQIIDVFVESPRSTSIPAFANGEPVTLLFKTTTLSSIVTCSVFKEVNVPLTVKFPPTVKSLVIVTLSGSPIVTAEFSDPEPETSISLAVPAIVAI